jgi:tyrosyl-tRNA synthetase
MDIEQKIHLIVKNTEEVIQQEELRHLLETHKRPRAYIGFELSGFLHLGTGVICANKFKDLAKAGFEVIIFLADWHSWINNKLGADREKIQIAGEYFKAAFEAVGIQGPNFKFIWAAELVNKLSYWEKVIRVGKASTLSRVMRVLPIMGRKADGEIESAFLAYPWMQVADIFEMEINLACGGMDQRKAHMLARDVADKIGGVKPVCLHTPLLTGLSGVGSKMDADGVPDLNQIIDAKMSKSKPETCIFIHDSPEEIASKLKKAHCPPKILRGNPIVEIVQYIIFDQQEEFTIHRPEKYGGDLYFYSFEEFSTSYQTGRIHPMDLKGGVRDFLIESLKAPREYFVQNSKMIEQMTELQQ